MKVNKIKNLSDFINKAEVLLVDDARIFNINKWELESDNELSESDITLPEPRYIKYKLDKEAIDKIIAKLPNSEILITDYWETKQFLKKHNLTKEDLDEVLKGLKAEDYVTNSKDVNNINNEACIFVRTTKVKGLGPFKLYIKLDYDSIEDTPVIVISIHETR